MYAVRRFAVRHARFFEALYQGFEQVIVANVDQVVPVFAAQVHATEFHPL